MNRQVVSSQVLTQSYSNYIYLSAHLLVHSSKWARAGMFPDLLISLALTPA